MRNLTATDVQHRQAIGRIEAMRQAVDSIGPEPAARLSWRAICNSGSGLTVSVPHQAA
jgi:hypothetical protein